MSRPIPKKTYTISLSPTKTIDVAIAEPDVRADNLSLTTWASSFVLANQLHNLDVRFDEETGDNDNTIPILELGAGTGLVGLTAALLWRRRVILTDLPGILSGLRMNVDCNQAALKRVNTDVACGSLDWNNANTLDLENGETYHTGASASAVPNGKQNKSKATVILAADTIYDESHPDLVSQAIFTWLARDKNARVVICYSLRVAYLDQIREIWTRFEEGGLTVVSEGQKRDDNGEWDDEGLCEWVVWKWKEVDGE